MDLELQLYRAITIRLPSIRGAVVLGNALMTYYRRRPRGSSCVNVLDFRMNLDPHECVESAPLFIAQL